MEVNENDIFKFMKDFKKKNPKASARQMKRAVEKKFNLKITNATPTTITNDTTTEKDGMHGVHPTKLQEDLSKTNGNPSESQ